MGQPHHPPGYNALVIISRQTCRKQDGPEQEPAALGGTGRGNVRGTDGGLRHAQEPGRFARGRCVGGHGCVHFYHDHD
eukprot:g17581.t1